MRSRAGGIDEHDDAGVTVEITLVLAKVRDVNNLFGSRDAVDRTARLIAHDNYRFTPEPLGIF